MAEDIFSSGSGIDSFIEDIYRNSSCNGEIPRRSKTRMSIAVPTKGLINAPGENNCYLNTSVQLLWHMDVFRRSFRLLEGHACLEKACIFCALKSIFQQFQDSNAAVLAADDLRKAMANAFMDDHRFQLGRMDDAAECFENILHRLHNHIANAEFADTCSAKHCVPHQKFGQHILEQTSCQCKATSEPKAFYQFVHYVSASSLVELVHNNSAENYQFTFGESLKTIMLCGERRPCPDERRCLYKGKQPVTKIQTTLMNCPDVVTVGVIWDSDHPSAKFISSFMDCIGENLFLIDLFDNISDDAHKRIGLNLSGVVAYYGKHYTSFFYNSRDKLWYYFDDENVQQLGSQWANVKSKFVRSKLQPLLLTYTNAMGEPVNIEDAPSCVDIVSKDKLLHQPPKDTIGLKPKRHSHKKKGRTHTNSFNSKSGKGNVNDACLTCDTDSPKSNRKSTALKDSASPNIGPRFGHSTLTNSNESSHNSHNKEPISLEHISVGGVSVNDSKHSEPSTCNYVTNVSTTTTTTTTTTSSSTFTSSAITTALKKTFNNITKNKYIISKNSKTLREQCLDPLKEANYADIGFDTQVSKEKTKSLPINRSVSDESDDHRKQLQNLERHQEVLNVSKISEKSRSEPVLTELDLMSHTGRNAGNSNKVDLTSATSNTEVVQLIADDDEYIQGEFESLVTKGEYYSNECDKCEKEGNTASALQLCQRAKSAFYNACHTPGIDESVLQFADLKYMQCVQKEKILQQDSSLALLQQKVEHVLSGEKEVNKPRSHSESGSHPITAHSESGSHPITAHSESGSHPITARSESGSHPITARSESGSHPIAEPIDQPCSLPDVVPSSQSGNNVQSDSVRSKCQTTVHSVESIDSSQQTECRQRKQVSTTYTPTPIKVTAPFYVPSKLSPNKSRNSSSDNSPVLIRAGSTGSIGHKAPQQPANTIERLRQSSLLHPRLYDPSAYTSKTTKNEKTHQPKTIYDPNFTLHPKKTVEKENEIKEINETSRILTTDKDDVETPGKLISESLKRLSVQDPYTYTPTRCAHCGWKTVEADGQLCFSCQSYL